MKMLSCAGVLFVVLNMVVVWASARVIQNCFGDWDIRDVNKHYDTACAVNITTDENLDRIPPVLYQIKCTECNSKCPSDYKCKQLTAYIEVKYKSSDKLSEYKLHTGCMCAKQGEPKQATTVSAVVYR